MTPVTKSGRPPGPRGSLFAGSLRELAARPPGFLLDVAREYGDIAAFRLGPKWRFLVSHPDLIEQVLVTDAKHYVKHIGARAFKPILGNGLITSEGDFWLRQRRLSQPAFLRSRVLKYSPVMADLTNGMLATWADGQRVDVQFEFNSLASAIALKTLFGLDDPTDRKGFTDSLQVALHQVGNRFRKLLRWPLWAPTTGNLRLRRAVAHLDRVIAGVVAAGRARTESGDDLMSR